MLSLLNLKALLAKKEPCLYHIDDSENISGFGGLDGFLCGTVAT